ncbi:flagellar motor protein MotB [Dyadobacter luteus]|uniref:Flagellar motor protein MotB n=1 Tax=Dyadobacter luteus TaxID=2259619 RepID=A0A3D8Y5M3_9BACT|nr:OmpA family protein [Dyadobacter luteus]REA57675.1 flagellar motor protein MotB [Dyadobacter luteus]
MSNSKIWWVLLAVWIAGSSYWHVCRIKQLCDAQPALPQSSSVIPVVEPLVISDSSSLQLRANGNFAFAKNGATTNFTSVLPELDSVYRYLSAKSGKQIVITGSFSPSEVNHTTFANPGEARAQAIRQWFLSKGLPDSLIVVNSVEAKNLVFQQDTLYGGIDFGFRNIVVSNPATTAPQSETDLANKERFESIFKPIDLYFPTASSEYIKTDQNQLFIAEAKKFLSDHADKKLMLTGHTDNEDSAEWNLVLSRKRANFVKKQFVALGLPENRIITDGKGESEPKASNETAQGKRANRRVSIVVK